MKFIEPRYSTPQCAFEDGLPYAAFYLLCFLFSQSSADGRCAPGYDAMMHALHTRCRNTINTNLKILKKRGWFHFAKRRGNQPKVMWVKIPARYKKRTDGGYGSVIEAMNA